MRIVCPDGTVEARRSLRPELEEKLRQLGSFTWFDGYPETEEIYLERVKDADGILIVWNIPSQVMSACSKLCIISFSGTDPRKFVDLPLATNKGIVVSNTPHYGDSAVAEHTLALILCCAKRLTRFNNLMHQGVWDQGGYNLELQGKTLGLVGLGGIGTEVARLAKAFGMVVLCWTRNPTLKRAHKHNVQFVTLEELFEHSDIVTVHIPQMPETERIITQKLLGLLKPGAIFVNTARGELVDNQALVKLLKNGNLGAVGLDVHDIEPIEKDNPFAGIENAVLTPHMAFNTASANDNMFKIHVENLLGFFSGNPQNVVNFDVLAKLKAQ